MNEIRNPRLWIGGLTKRVLWASGWAISNNAVRQVLRLASNLVLSRLLFPSAFGTMAIVSSVLAGLEMLSDVGVGPSIIRNPRPTPRIPQHAVERADRAGLGSMDMFDTY